MKGVPAPAPLGLGPEGEVVGFCPGERPTGPGRCWLLREPRLQAFAEGFGASPTVLIDAALSAQAEALTGIDRLCRAGVEP